MTNNSLISARGIEVGATAAGTGPSNPAVAGGNIFLSNFLAIEATIPPSGPAGNDIVTNESLAGGGVIDFALILPTGFVRDNLGLSFAELRSNSQNDLSTNGLIDILDTGIFEEAAAIPLAFVDVSDLVGDSCSAGTSEGSEFTVGGQGGLPANPTQPLSPALDNNDWILLDELDNASANSSQNSQLARQPQQPKGVCLNSLLSQTIQQ
ncbi:MAG: hypothetical protein F6K04_01875 [Leptolyngbya sp. SIO4C5]|nr:hypothetical protein [Leptolyngbya sp. SIO4C5]